MNLTIIMLTTAALVMAAAIDTVNCDQAAVGQPPAGWTAARTGSGDAKWTIEKDDTAPSKRTSSSSPVPRSASRTIRACRTVCVEAKFKAIDANNYYIARANALEDNITIYHTINGRRTEKKRANMMVAPDVWHTLRADFQGSHFTVTYDGKTALEWDHDTFKDAGKVGVWDEGR